MFPRPPRLSYKRRLPGGYVIKATDQMTAQAPELVKIRYNNVSLIGSAPQTNLFCRGAYGTYSGEVAFNGASGNIRGFCLTIGDNGGPNGTAGEAVSNVTISNLHLYGMTNGNTFNVNFGYPPQSSDGWDVTHKGIYMWDNSPGFSNITINSVVIQDFKAENIYSGGSPITGMVIENSTLTNFNGNGISMLAADLQVLNNTISNGSNAAVENSTVSKGAAALIRQLYQGNTVSQFPREGIVVVGVDGGIASGSVQIVNNYFDTIAQTNPSGTESAIYIASQNNFIPPANVTVTGNTCHDCQSFGVFETSGNTLVQSNAFIVDHFNAGSVFGFTYQLSGVTIASNTGMNTGIGHSLGSVYVMNPGYASGSFPWNNVVIKGNTWTFPGTPQYEFVTSSGLGWSLVTQYNLTWQGDSCSGCTHPDMNHGQVDLSRTNLIEPYGPVVYVSGNSSPVTVTVDASKEQDGAQIQVVNAGSNPVSFASDSNLSLSSTITLPGGGNNSATFVYSAALGKYTSSQSSDPAAVVNASASTPQSATVNTPFGTALQAVVKDASNNLLGGVMVTFSAPSTGATASFSGSSTATAVTNSSGIATAPALTANGQTGSYTVTANVAGVTSPASFSLTNTPAISGGGSLSGSGNSATTTFSLTPEGTADWVHWGDAALNRKTGVSAQISNYAVVGSGPVMTYTNDPRALSWTDGTPTISGSNNNGVYINSLQNGFSFTVPADANKRTLTVHVGGYMGGGTFTAHLLDGSAADYVDSTAVVNGQYDRNYTLTYNAASAGQTLKISWVTSSGAGNVTLNGAALSVAAPGITATAGTPQSTTVNTAFNTSLQAAVTDASNNPLSGVTVTFTAPGAGASASFGGSATATAITNASGIAIAPVLTANGQPGTYLITASAAGITPTASYSLTNLAGVPASITAAGGTPQSATVNTPFGTALQAVVKDASNNLLSGVMVTFSAPSTGATASFSGSSTATAVTNSSGIATAPALTANGQTGSYTVTANVAGVTSPASFSLTNTPAISGGGSLSGSGNSATTTFSLTPEGTADWVHWGDAALNRKTGVSAQISNYAVVGSGPVMTYTNDPRALSWTDGTPTISGSNTNGVYINSLQNGFSFTVPADANKAHPDRARGWLYGKGGTFTAHLLDVIGRRLCGFYGGGQRPVPDRNYTLTYNAASAGQTLKISWVTSSGAGNVTLNGAALSVAAPGITATAGTPQSTTVNTAFNTSLQAAVTDASNNPLSGVTVTFTAPGAGASASFGGSATATAITNASGIAIAPVLTANGQPGTYLITASAAGITPTASYSLTNLAGVPASITAAGGTPQSATVNTPFGTALQAVVKDASNNLLSGVMVTFSAPSTGATASFSGSSTATAVTNSSGIATASALTANGQAGTYTLTASVAGVTSPGNFTLTNTTGSPATITATAGTPQSTSVNNAFGAALQALVKDSGNNPLGGVTVAFAAPPVTGVTGTFSGSPTATAVTNASGIATAPVLTANSQAGTYTVMASVAGVTTKASFSLTNLSGTPASITANAGTPQAATVNSTFGTSLQVLVKDASSNLLSGVTVTFTAPATGATASFSGSAIASAITNSNGIATAPVLTANAQAGSYTIMASATGVSTPANFSLTNNVVSAVPIKLLQGNTLDSLINLQSATIAFKSNNTAGNWIGVIVSGTPTNSDTFTVTDTNGNTYRPALVSGSPALNSTLGIYYAENIKAGANTIKRGS